MNWAQTTGIGNGAAYLRKTVLCYGSFERAMRPGEETIRETIPWTQEPP